MSDAPRVEPLDELLRRDLDAIDRRLADVFGRMAGTKLLMTGGGGFLGYYMVQALTHHNERVPADERIDVTVWDNYARGVPAWLEELAARGAVTVDRHDVRDPLPDPMPEFDWIVHAAGIASPIYYRRRPIETMDANVGGLRRLLDHAASRADGAHPLRGFLFFSSSEIYGDPPPEHIPTPEDYRGNVSCTGPRACYDESKRYGETLCVNFARVHGVPVRMARPFNNYGPGLKITDRRVIPDFCRDVLEGRDIVLLSDGSPTRTFCYAADAVCGYYRVLVLGRDGRPYNIGADAPEVSMRDLAGRIARIAGELFDYRGRVIHQPPAEDDYLVDNPNRRCPDLTRARTELGYAPEVDLDEGLRRSLVWYHYHREGSDA